MFPNVNLLNPKKGKFSQELNLNYSQMANGKESLGKQRQRRFSEFTIDH